ncbi:two-component system response regulator [Alteromonas mediterranea]|uniref:HD-GYP domain-containing protein n=1 Tax=Alteromonas mediterranea TaxID=314275 RepID=UPI00090414E3|nr:HD domain-containing phosphohydrolase [Alteromonas mediterranea]APE03743.1 two-component system response regulator [Alteromonas mediterranea]
MTEQNKTKHRFSILVVDDEPANIDILLGILGPFYDVKVAPSGAIALKITQQFTPDLILLDIMMPGMDGFEVCRQLKSDKLLSRIPVIFVTALSQGENEEKGFELGAVDYITKPVSPSLALARVKTHISLAHQMQTTENLVVARTEELTRSQQSAITMLATAGHYNDTDTGHHIWRMAAYSKCLAIASGWSYNDACLLAQAAPMHDTGKIGIPDSILKAPRRLTNSEMEVMRTHAQIGHKILSQCETPLFNLAAEIALCHHEKWNGTGYPEGLTGEEIPESARIVAIADVFDALTMQRPYKKAWTVDEAFAHLSNDAGSHFDPDLVDCFLSIKEEIIETKRYWNALEAEGSMISIGSLL